MHFENPDLNHFCWAFHCVDVNTKEPRLYFFPWLIRWKHEKSALPSIVERSHCIDRQAGWYKRNHKILFGGLNNENVNFLHEVMAHQSNWQCIGIKHLHLVLSISYFFCKQASLPNLNTNTNTAWASVTWLPALYLSKIMRLPAVNTG